MRLLLSTVTHRIDKDSLHILVAVRTQLYTDVIRVHLFHPANEKHAPQNNLFWDILIVLKIILVSSLH